MARMPHSVVVSCELDLNLDILLDRIWDELALSRIYTKKRGEPPDFAGPLVVRRNATVEHVVVRPRRLNAHGSMRFIADWSRGLSMRSSGGARPSSSARFFSLTAAPSRRRSV